MTVAASLTVESTSKPTVLTATADVLHPPSLLSASTATTMVADVVATVCHIVHNSINCDVRIAAGTVVHASAASSQLAPLPLSIGVPAVVLTTVFKTSVTLLTTPPKPL